MTRKLSSTGHIVTVFYYVPTEDRDEAIAEVQRLVDISNNEQDITIYDKGWYYGFAEMRGTEDVTFDYDEEGIIIGYYT